MRHLVAATTLSALVALGGLSGCVIAPPAVVGVDAEVQIAPPPLPLYVQPLAPGPGYLWTPGYWGWSAGGYYWIPGTWVLPPTVGLLWTPGWWGWAGGGYRWHAGYWGAQVGFYGGVDYGFGYFGVGYSGGQWRGNQFYYNTAISHVDVTHVTNVYVDKTVIV
ncbi:MAG TPA: YXWGXW repeat-containing protein, partial [Rubrivivax sp.]|nr:YXWGXW repeat-containing protein [Rubrivivax sp.]